MTDAGKFDILLVMAGGATTALDRASGAVAHAADARSALAALKPVRGAAILVASDAVFQQAVRLPAAQTGALSPQELESALFYEIEPFCGLRRDEAALAYERLPGGEWAVAAVSAMELERLGTEVHAARCRLRGVTALPKGVGEEPNAILSAILADNAAAPVIAMPRQSPLAPHHIAAASAALLAVAALGCVADWLWLSARERALAPRLAQSEAAAAANGRVLAEIRADERRVAEIEDERRRREEAASAIASARDAWPCLLSTIAEESAGGDFAITAISAPDGGGACVNCIAPSSAAASAAMARLSTALAARGWELRPNDIREGSAGLATFSFLARRGGEGAETP